MLILTDFKVFTQVPICNNLDIIGYESKNPKHNSRKKAKIKVLKNQKVQKENFYSLGRPVVSNFLEIIESILSFGLLTILKFYFQREITKYI